jgi:hypothetical protein
VSDIAASYDRNSKYHLLQIVLLAGSLCVLSFDHLHDERSAPAARTAQLLWFWERIAFDIPINACSGARHYFTHCRNWQQNVERGVVMVHSSSPMFELEKK